MAKIRNIKRKNIYNPTDLRVVLSGVASWSVSANITQTVTLTNLWLSRSENTVIKVYLPAWLTFVSSPNGVHSGGVITWTRGTVKDAFTDTFVVTSDTADDYEIVAVVETTTYDTDPANSTDTHTLTIAESGYAVEIRTDNIYMATWSWPIPANVTAFVWSVSGNLMPIFIEDIQQFDNTIWRLWYLTENIPAQNAASLSGDYGNWYGGWYYVDGVNSYNWSDAVRTIDTTGEPF